MSRSRRKRPYWSHYADSQKEWKREYNRQHRHINKQRLKLFGEDAEFVPKFYGLGNVWCSPKDGTNYYQGRRPIESGEYERYSWWTLEEAQKDWDRGMRK